MKLPTIKLGDIYISYDNKRKVKCVKINNYEVSWEENGEISTHKLKFEQEGIIQSKWRLDNSIRIKERLGIK